VLWVPLVIIISTESSSGATAHSPLNSRRNLVRARKRPLFASAGRPSWFRGTSSPPGRPGAVSGGSKGRDGRACDLRAGVRLAVASSPLEHPSCDGGPCSTQQSGTKRKRRRGGRVCRICGGPLVVHLLATPPLHPRQEPSSLTATRGVRLCASRLGVMGSSFAVKSEIINYTKSCSKYSSRCLTSHTPHRSTCALPRPVTDTIFSEAKGRARSLAQRWESPNTPSSNSMLDDLLERSKGLTSGFLARIARQGSSLQPSAKERPQAHTAVLLAKNSPSRRFKLAASNDSLSAFKNPILGALACNFHIERGPHQSVECTS